MCTVRLYVERFVQATRLPFNPGSPSHLSTRRCPTWRSAGARRPQRRAENRRRKRAPEMSGAITERHTRTFLSQTGPQIQLELVQAGHHLVGFNTFRIAFRHKKDDPWGRPRFALLCAPEVLACTPRCEGYDESELALRVEVMPARHRRRDWRRFGEFGLGVDVIQH